MEQKNENTIKPTTPSNAKIQPELSINNSDLLINKIDNLFKELQEIKISLEKLDNKLKK